MSIETRRPRGAQAFFMLILTLALASCAGTRNADPILLTLDEAFTALFPVCAASTAERLGAGDFKAVPLSNLERSIGKTLEDRRETVLVHLASPLAAFVLEDLGSRRNTETEDFAARPIVAFFPAGIEAPIPVPQAEAVRIYPVVYDYEKAYRGLAREAAATMKKLEKQAGRKVECAIVFQENFMRDSKVLEILTGAIEAVMGPASVRLSRMDSSETLVDTAGSIAEAIASVTTAETGLVILAVDNPSAARTAAAGDPGRQYFVDASSWGEPGGRDRLFRYRIEANEKGLAAAAVRLARRIAGGRDAEASALVSLPERPWLRKIF